jgi:transposase
MPEGYDALPLRQELAFHKTATVIPSISTRKQQWPQDRETHKARTLVERIFFRPKDFRRIASRRYDKLARDFASAVATIIWWTD